MAAKSKPVEKKAAAKKPAAKNVAVKGAAEKTAKRATKAASKPAAATAVAEKQTKSQIIAAVAEETGLSRKDVSGVFAAFGSLVERHMKKRGSGEITIPEVGVKIRRIVKPATKARKGVNPFTGEATVFKAKPARNVVKLTALKALKETVTK